MARPHYQVLIDWSGDSEFDDADEDVTADVVLVNIDRLRDPITDYMNGTVLDLQLNNADHKYSPSKGTITGLQPGRKVWVRMWYPYDDFIGAVDTGLDAHTPDLDSEWAWVEVAGDWSLDGSGAAQTASAEARLTAAMEFNDADVTVYTRLTKGASNVKVGICVRMSSGGGDYAQVIIDGSTLFLDKRVSSSTSTVASTSHSWANGTTKDLWVQIHGNRFRIYINNILELDVELDDAALNGNTRHGLYSRGSTNSKWENFGGFRSLFFGKIDTIKPRPRPGAEYCYIRAVDDFEIARATTLFMASDASFPQQTKDILDDVLDFMDIASDARILDFGEHLVPNDGEDFSGPSWNVDALSAIQKLQDEEDGFIYIDGYGFWRFEDYGHKLSPEHKTPKSIYKDTDDGTNPYFEDLSWEDGVEYIENVIDMQIAPGTDGATANFFSMKEVPFFNAAESRDFLVEATFDAIAEEIAPVVTTDYTANTKADGSGSDLSGNLTVSLPDPTRFNGKGALIRVVWGSTPGYLTKLDMRADVVVTFDDAIKVQREDSASITDHGRRVGSLTARFIREVAQAGLAIERRLDRREALRTRLTLKLNGGTKETMSAMIHRQMGDMVTVTYSDMGIDEDFSIEGESWSIVEAGRVFTQEIGMRSLTDREVSLYLSPGTMADDAASGDVVWANVDNAKLSDDSDASRSLTPGQTSHYLKATNFGFAIPSGATIIGIELVVEHAGPLGIVEIEHRIVKGGTITGDDKSTGSGLPTTDNLETFGSSADLWGLSWTRTDINASDFGFAIRYGSASGTHVVTVDHMKCRITYTP